MTEISEQPGSDLCKHEVGQTSIKDTDTSTLLDAAAGATQNFVPLKSICGFLNAFHMYADEPNRPPVEACHYCAHINDDMRQCLIYDSPDRNARLIGIEYMVSPKLFETLPAEEQKLWHSHVFEVKSGMLIMPRPVYIPPAVWKVAETKEMELIIGWYGKTYHLWQTDRGDTVPLGEPKLMGSYTSASQVDLSNLVADRDRRFDTDTAQNASAREHLENPQIHPHVDVWWKR